MILEVKNLHKSYKQMNKNLEILKGLDLNLDEAESVAILGKSGSGKSTLLNLLAGLDQFDEGEIHLLNKPYSSLSQAQLTEFRSSRMGIIFQQFHLIAHLTALENVLLPLEILGDFSGKERAEMLLEKVELSHRLNHFPGQLSGGEKQRVAIARALIGNPKLILADEPSGSLDEETGQKIMNLLFSLQKEENTSLILVTHERSLAKECHRSLTLSQGILHEANK